MAGDNTCHGEKVTIEFSITVKDVGDGTGFDVSGIGNPNAGTIIMADPVNSDLFFNTNTDTYAPAACEEPTSAETNTLGFPLVKLPGKIYLNPDYYSSTVTTENRKQKINDYVNKVMKTTGVDYSNTDGSILAHEIFHDLLSFGHGNGTGIRSADNREENMKPLLGDINSLLSNVMEQSKTNPGIIKEKQTTQPVQPSQDKEPTKD